MSTLKFLENYCGIYGYQNTNTGKIHYIGQTIQPFIIRDRQHRIQKTNTLCDRKLQKHPEEYQMIPILPFTIGNTTNDELYPNVECDHDFKIYSGIRRWCLIWECKKCGFICFCSCFKEAIEGCKQGKIITELKLQDNYGNEIIDKITQNVSIKEKSRKERGFILRDLNLDADNIPYYDNACEVCRGKTSSHRYCSKMYARSEFEIKYGAYVKKKFFEYKLLNDEINDEDLKRKANNATREELGFKKIGERFVTETELYRIVKSIFPNDNVIHHYRAKWLKRQEIDIFIPHLSLAIEYDGIQHFKPIKAWGGEKGLKKNIKRDKIKEEKCKENNVTLIRFTYKEDDLLSENYVKSKLKKYKIDVQ